jgi:aminopeptidase-like protein
MPFCEPQLGNRGLYRPTGGQTPELANLAKLWLMSFSDGQHGLLDIAERAGMPFSVIRDSAVELERHGLLSRNRPIAELAQT